MSLINPWREIYDSAKSRDPWKYGVPDFALYLDVEPTNHCNFNCKFCVSKQAKRPRGYMDMDLYREICRQGQKYGTRGIRFLRWGEPLLNRNMVDMVDIATKHNLLTQITTNGSLLTEDMASGLVHAGLSTIIVSMQGLNEAEYTRFRGDNYDKTIQGLKNLCDFRDKNGYLNPYIVISTTITDENEEDIEKFKEKWKKVVDDVSVGYTWFKRLKNKEPIKDYISRAKVLPHYFRCQEVMIKLSIDWDGTVSPCCLDYDQQLSVGNMKDNTLMELWLSPQVKAIRTLLSQKRQDMFALCQTCELNYGFRGQE